MESVTRPQLHHIALTVTDLDTSVHWYEGVFGVRFQKDLPHDGGVGRLLADDARELIIRAAPPRCERSRPVQGDGYGPRSHRPPRADPE